MGEQEKVDEEIEKKIDKEAEKVLENFDNRFKQDPFNEMLCPLIKAPCAKEKCLAFKTFHDQWEDTELSEQLTEVDGIDVSLKADIATGRVYEGDVSDCKLGVFERKVSNIKLVSEKVTELKPVSSIILTSSEG